MPEVQDAGNKKDSRNIAGKNLAVPHGARWHNDRTAIASGVYPGPVAPSSLHGEKQD
jgi:hypothetical protein